MFSGRLPRPDEKNDLSRMLEARQQSGARILDLTETNPTRAGFQYAEAELRESASACVYRPEPRGLPEARAAIAGYYEAEGLEVEANHVVLTASTSEGYSFLFKLLCDPGDSILVPEPSYPLFEHLAALEGIQILRYSLRYGGEGWKIDLDELKRKTLRAPRALVVVHPNNPTGSYVRSAELEAMDRLCVEHDMALIADEVFFDYPRLGRGHRASAHATALTFSLSGLSKVCGLPQAKLAWILASGPESLVREALERLELIADAYLSVGSAVQEATPALLSGRESIQTQIRARLVHNEAMLEEAGYFRVRPREAGWYAVLELPDGTPSEGWATEILEKEGILLHPGYFYDFEEDNLVVGSLLAPEEIWRASLETLVERPCR